MLEALLSIGKAFEPSANSAVLKMGANDRMAGSVPVWEAASTAKEQTEQKFAQALNEVGQESSPFRLALLPELEASSNVSASASDAEKPFGFGDILDMINPLHHIPVLGSLYREFTGDSIRGSGKVIGGAIFGGPLGAASSMVNMVIEHDTGRDIAGHALDRINGRKNNAVQDRANLSAVSEGLTVLNSKVMTQAILEYEMKENLNRVNNSNIRTKQL